MFAVVTKSEKMPASCWGKYRQVAVVELEPGYTADDVTMISDRAKAVRRIVEYWGKLNVGISSRSAYARAVAAAEEICAQLNAKAVKM